MSDDNTSYAADLRATMSGTPSGDDVDEAIRVLSAEARFRKKAEAIRKDRALMAAVRERVKELTKPGRRNPEVEGE